MTVLREYQTEAVRMIAGSKKDPGYLADSPVAGLIIKAFVRRKWIMRYVLRAK